MQDKESSQKEFAEIELSEADFSNADLRAVVMSRLASTQAERALVRPHISALRVILNVLIPLVFFAAVFCALYFTLPKYQLEIALGVSLGGLFLYIAVRLRSILIWCILVYQRFAPTETRLRCVFTPSCSEYAILALKKYGVMRGVPKIISRLKRCHPPNGGDDPLK